VSSAGEQWAKVPESVAYADLDATAMRVLIIMAAKAGRDRVTWITQRTMGERLERDRTTIGRAIRRLEKLNLVRKCGKVVVDYELGTWVQKYKVAPYLPEVRSEVTSGVPDEEPNVRLGGTRSASRQGAEVGLGRTHSVPSSSVPQRTSASASSPDDSPPLDAPWKDYPGGWRAFLEDQRRSEEEPASEAGEEAAVDHR